MCACILHMPCTCTCTSTFLRPSHAGVHTLNVGAYSFRCPCIIFEPLSVFSISTISPFVFKGYSWPVRLIKYLPRKKENNNCVYMYINSLSCERFYLHFFLSSKCRMQTISASNTLMFPHLTSRLSGVVKTLSKHDVTASTPLRTSVFALRST